MKRRAAFPLVAASGFAVAADEFHDSAPPKAEKFTPIDTAPAKANPTVRFHAKPKPLAPGAMTHFGPVFLDPGRMPFRRKRSCCMSGRNRVRRWFGRCGPHRGTVRQPLQANGWSSFTGSLRAESGEKYWEFRCPKQFEDRYGYNNGPRASPVIEGERVYTYGSEGKLHCFRPETGQLYWKRDLAAGFKVPQDFSGTAATPLIEGGLLIINVGAPGGPTVAAFDKTSGRMVWGKGKEWSHRLHFSVARQEL